MNDQTRRAIRRAMGNSPSPFPRSIQDQVSNLTGGARADGAFGIGRDL